MLSVASHQENGNRSHDETAPRTCQNGRGQRVSAPGLARTGEKGALALRCRDRVGAAAVEDSVQATQVSTDEWIEKMQCVYMHTDTHTHTGVLRSNKKERNLATCDDVDGP